MTTIRLFDDEKRTAFLPFTYSRPVGEMRVGALTMREKWEAWTGAEVDQLIPFPFRGKYPFKHQDPDLYINARLLPEAGILEQVKELRKGEALFQEEGPVAFRPGRELENDALLELYDLSGIRALCEECTEKGRSVEGRLLNEKWELFTRIGECLEQDLPLLENGKSSISPDPSNTLIGETPPFIEEGAKVKGATINTGDGPVHIAADAEVMEGCTIRGPFYLGPHGTLKMGAKIYGPTSIGPYGKVGGEVNNSVIFGYSNKAHDGFLGNSVIGEWCNLGADTNNSNLKNNYGPVRVWDHEKGEFVDSGLTFCGIFMGDHSKCGINTMFNTGTSIGFSANIFGGGFPPKFIPSYFWGGSEGGSEFRLDKAKEVGRKMRERRKLDLDESEERIFDAVYERTKGEREGFGISNE